MKKKKVSLMMTYPSVLWRSQIIVCFQVIEQINYTIIMHCGVITIEYIAIKTGIMSAIQNVFTRVEREMKTSYYITVFIYFFIIVFARSPKNIHLISTLRLIVHIIISFSKGITFRILLN